MRGSGVNPAGRDRSQNAYGSSPAGARGSSNVSGSTRCRTRSRSRRRRARRSRRRAPRSRSIAWTASRLLAPDQPEARADPQQPAGERRIARESEPPSAPRPSAGPTRPGSCGCCRCRRAGRRLGHVVIRHVGRVRQEDDGSRRRAARDRQAHDRRRARLLLECPDPHRTRAAGRHPRQRRRSGARCRRAPLSGGCPGRDGRGRGRAGAVRRRKPSLREPLVGAERPPVVSSPSQERRTQEVGAGGSHPDAVVVGQHLVDVGRIRRVSCASSRQDVSKTNSRSAFAITSRSPSPRRPSRPARRRAGSGRRRATRSPAPAP